MDRLELVIAVSDVLLGVYGSGDKRKAALIKQFGKDGQLEIQKEVTRCLADSAEDKYIAVACIAGRYGNDAGRVDRLGRWADKAQARINKIWAMRGKSITAASKDVINGNYDKDTVRTLLLKFCGYDADKVQAEVNRLLYKPSDPTATKFRIHAEHFFRKDEKQYGDCTAIYQYASDGTIAKCVLIDCAKASASSVVIEDLRAQGVKRIDAIFLSHAHGDHYCGLSNIIKAFPVGWLYLPDCTELDKHQKGYGNALRRQAKKVANHRYIKAGDSVQIGEIRCDCVFICPAKKLSEHDSHHFVNNQSMAIRVHLGKAIFHTAGDMSNPANNIMVDSLRDMPAHVFKLQWHGDGNAINEKLMKCIRPRIAFSNYHHLERSGRGGSRKKVEAVGGVVYRNAEDGQIYIDICGNLITVTTSKSKRKDVYKI